MQTDSTRVALLAGIDYDFQDIAEGIAQLCNGLDFTVSRGSRVLLKPNLLTSRSTGHLACTHPVFVAAAAAWFVEQGARVIIGDSPAFGTARGVMKTVGIADVVSALPVQCIDFDQTITVKPSEKLTVNVAQAALECDLLINLPRAKAHSQFHMTLALKNYFGTVAGFQKPCWHLRYGNAPEQFAANLVDLMLILPAGLSLLDGIVAMQGTGPVSGLPYPLGLIGASTNPVALDTAVYQILGLDLNKSMLWQECAKRGLAGHDPNRLDFPLESPENFSVEDFKSPAFLKPVSFNPLRMLVSACRRFAVRLQE